jgi:hypothetical protein
MKHIKLFGAIQSKINESMGIELPEGYEFTLFNPNDKADCKRHFEEGDTENWSGMTFEEWMGTLDQMGEIDYQSGNSYYRGVIDWEEMGISYIYEIHPI